jgi:ABC-type phosphate/phosphonate transport system substrate-binding protein
MCSVSPGRSALRPYRFTYHSCLELLLLINGCTIRVLIFPCHPGGCAINGKAVFGLVLMLVMLVAACRQVQVQGPLVAATATATPRSTPLPVVATEVPPGTEDNPIRMLINPQVVVTDAQTAAFEEALQEQSALVVEVVVVERYAEALAALCDSSPASVAVAWLDGITLQAAVAQNCGQPIMQVERGQRSSRTSGEAGQIITSRSLGLSSVGALASRTFCRLAADDYYSWLVPTLMLRAGGVDPVNNLEAVVDYSSRNELIQAVIDGECDATGISETDFDDLRDVQKDGLSTVETTPELPYAVLMYPLSLPLGERIRLDNALLGMVLETDGSEVMEPLLGQSGLARVEEGDLEDLSAFLNSTGLDFAQLGQ